MKFERQKILLFCLKEAKAFCRSTSQMCVKLMLLKETQTLACQILKPITSVTLVHMLIGYVAQKFMRLSYGKNDSMAV